MQTSTHTQAIQASPKLKADVATLDTLAELAGFDCKLFEIASSLHVSVDEFRAFLNETPEARAAMKRGYDEGTQRLQRSCEHHAAAERAQAGKRDARKQRPAASGVPCQTRLPAQFQRLKT